MHRWIGFLVMFASLLSVATWGAAARPFKERASTGQFSPERGTTRVAGERLILSQYGKSGNAFDILALDPATLEPRVLIEERQGGRFIAQDDRFLVIQQQGDVAKPLIVLDATSHKELARVRLLQRVSRGRIQGDHLLLIQGPEFSSSHLKATPALIYSLPTLQLLRSTQITGGNGADSWGEYIVSLGQDLAVYDDQFEPVGTAVTFPAASARGNSNCSGRNLLAVAEEKAVVSDMSCRAIYIVDLATRSIQQSIGAYSSFHSAQAIDGILFTSATNDAASKQVHAFDMSSGQLLAILPIAATDGLFSVGSQLLAVTHDAPRKMTITSFTLDTASLRDGTWRLAEVMNACKLGERIVAETGDIYRAIDLCQSAGIDGLIGTENLAPEIRSLVRSYATWRSQTFDQWRQATETLEWLVASGTPKEEVSSALLEAFARRKLMLRAAIVTPVAASEIDKKIARDRMALQDLDERELTSEIGRAIVKNPTGLPIRTLGVGPSFEPMAINPDGKFVYGWRYRCDGECDDSGPVIAVQERESWREVAKILLLPYQDGDKVKSIAVDAQYLYVSIDNPQPSEDHANLIVIDKATRAIVNRVHLDIDIGFGFGVGTLTVSNGELLSCSCQQSTCRTIDTQTFETHERDFQECSSVLVANGYRSSRIFDGGERWEFVHTADGHKTQFDLANVIEQPLLPDVPHTAIFLKAAGNEHSVMLGDLRTGALRTLLTLPVLPGLTAPQLVTSGSTLIISYGRDLLLLDLKTSKLRKYFPDFIAGGFNNNGNSVDRNQITRMHVDGDRLIINTYDGRSSLLVKVLDLLNAT